MKSSRGILAAAALAAGLAWPATAQEKEESKKTMAAGAQSTSITATVEAINTAARELTLKGPDGNVVVMGVPESVKRFSEIKVGDRLTFRYTEALLLELHKADAAAKLEMSEVSGVERLKGEKPGGIVSRQITATVAVEAVDAAAPSITVKTSDGNTQSFRVKDKKKLEGVHSGDKFVITYHEAVAVQVSAPAAK
jgi:Cu/Ag efflux protein CusF